MKASYQTDTVAENEVNAQKKRMEKIFTALDFEHPPEVCPIRNVLAEVLDKWSILIMFFLAYRELMRFGELKRQIAGISPKMLTKSLRTLERDGYVKRQMFAEVPVRVEYQLTEQGRSFVGMLLDMAEWIDTFMPAIVKKRHEFDLLVKQK